MVYADNRDNILGSVVKIQLQGLRLEIEPATLDL